MLGCDKKMKEENEEEESYVVRERERVLLKNRRHTGNKKNGNHDVSNNFSSPKRSVQPRRNSHSNGSKTTVKPNQSIEECSTMFR